MTAFACCLLVHIAFLTGGTPPSLTTSSVVSTPTPSAIHILLDAAQPVDVPNPPVSTPLVINPKHDALSEIADFPTKIWVADPLRDTVAQMWKTSPTFRRQAQQVQASGPVQVQLRLDTMLAGNPHYLALGELRRYDNGGLIARVSVSPVRTAEMIGHEMEHVCERLEGIRIEREAHQHVAGYHVVGAMNERYESERAIRVGRQVMAETSFAGILTRTQ